MSTDDVTAAIRSCLDEWKAEGYTPRQINHGECLPFANDVAHQCSGVELKRTGDEDVLGPPENPQYDVEPFHVWVFDGSQHYDAEAPDGVATWRDLPFFQRTGYGGRGTY